MNKGTIELTTKRLVLRRHILEDAESLYRDFGLDPKMFEYSGWNPYATIEMATKTVSRFIDSYEDDRFYGWAVEQDGQLIGTVGAYDYDPQTGAIEIGCSIRRQSWGKGFATEAVRAVLKYLTGQEGIRCVKAWCAADNMGSRRIMEKAGMQFAGEETGSLEIEGCRYDKLNYVYTAEGGNL